MALNFNRILIGSAQPEALAAFYRKALDKEPEFAQGGYSGWQVGAAQLVVGPHSEVAAQAKEPQRVLVNFETNDVQAEFARIAGIGAKVIKEPYQMEGMGPNWICTLADPDGNFLQITTPM
jgi:predicted enzyme related to lactoylglutathione lyase